MDGDRKYRQHGYQDSDRSGNNGFRSERPRPQGPKPALDVTGPKLPRLVQSVVASRCYCCSTTLAADTDWKGACPKCHAALHCCKQCVHFEPSTRFQCLKPIPVRIPAKDQANECAMFSSRVTVTRDGEASGLGPNRNTAPMSGMRPGGNGAFNGGSAQHNSPSRNFSDARAAFDSLFKK